MLRTHIINFADYISESKCGLRAALAQEQDDLERLFTNASRSLSHLNVMTPGIFSIRSAPQSYNKGIADGWGNTKNVRIIVSVYSSAQKYSNVLKQITDVPCSL